MKISRQLDIRIQRPGVEGQGYRKEKKKRIGDNS
jgi:hypothetical protein